MEIFCLLSEIFFHQKSEIFLIEFSSCWGSSGAVLLLGTQRAVKISQNQSAGASENVVGDEKLFKAICLAKLSPWHIFIYSLPILAVSDFDEGLLLCFDCLMRLNNISKIIVGKANVVEKCETFFFSSLVDSFSSFLHVIAMNWRLEWFLTFA